MLTLSALGLAMSNLATLYSGHGRHQDALAMHEKALELRRHLLPVNHPDNGAACMNAGVSYLASGDLLRALEFVREALRIFQATLPPSHPYVQRAQLLLRSYEGDAARRL